MKVEITHNVDVVPGQFYNFLIYDFVTETGLIRARAYADRMSEVSILGRFKPDGSPPDAVTSNDPAEAINAIDPRGDTQFDEVLTYLRKRFSEIQSLGPDGYGVIAHGLSREEREAPLEAGFYQTVVVDVDLDGGSA